MNTKMTMPARSLFRLHKSGLYELLTTLEGMEEDEIVTHNAGDRYEEDELMFDQTLSDLLNQWITGIYDDTGALAVISISKVSNDQLSSEEVMPENS